LKLSWSFAVPVAAVALAGAAPIASGLYRQMRAEKQQELFRAELSRRLSAADDSPVLAVPDGDEESGEQERDEQLALRQLAQLAYYGEQDASAVERLLQAAADERERWPDRMADPLGTRALDTSQLALSVVSGHSWTNLGPSGANFEFNGARYPANDSGRVGDIAVDPRDPDVVYVAASIGGLWKTYNFFSAPDENPTWHPLFDTVGNISIGAIALDPQNPDTLYVALGDPFDPTTGGRVAKSTDGGGSWTIGPQLTGIYQVGSARTESAVSARAIAVDPTDSRRLFVATEVGLFRSTDGGTSFSLASLPTSIEGRVTLESSAWSIVYLGSADGKSRWLVSGVYACQNSPPPRSSGAGVARPGSAPRPGCPGGNPGDLWRSTDSGATWVSLRQAGLIPGEIPPPGVGRMALAAGDSSDSRRTAVYALASSMNESDDGTYLAKTIAILKSTDGAGTFQVLATSTTPVSNPVQNNCPDMDVGHGQSFYNLAVAVNPTNSDQVILGGNFCGVRSLSGGSGASPWDNIAHWLPTATAPLPYVHADWHVITTARRGNELWVLAGTDGGIFASSNVFAASPPNVVWSYRRNRGMTSHQFYSIGSGDPANGNPYVVFGGLQDNGTRFREMDPDPSTHLPQSTIFNQVQGGDGVASVVAYAGSTEIYWGALPGGPRLYCRRQQSNCNAGGTQWSRLSLTAPTGDAEPFFIRYAALDGDPNGAVLTVTAYNVFKINSNSTGLPTVVRLTDDQFIASSSPIRHIWASPKIYSDASGSFRLYGLALSGTSTRRFAVGVDPIGGTPSWTVTPQELGVGSAPNQLIGYTTAVAFPSSAGNFQPGVRDRDGKVLLVGSTAVRMTDEVTLVPDSVGHLFLTVDGGHTWRPFGTSGPNRLPNVPVQVVKFDPADSSDRTIYVGTDLGVYRTTDQGANWDRFGVGFPFVRVTDLFIAKNGSLLRAATFGRGVWELYPNADAPAGVKGDGDFDRNQQIDFRDLAALASRLGTTPSTGGQPFYDWRLDLVGSSNAVDEADLTALLSLFGSHP
jgi:photosystem II stability/assembly factor-like uncharacterized protein